MTKETIIVDVELKKLDDIKEFLPDGSEKQFIPYKFQNLVLERPSQNKPGEERSEVLESEAFFKQKKSRLFKIAGTIKMDDQHVYEFKARETTAVKQGEKGNRRCVAFKEITRVYTMEQATKEYQNMKEIAPDLHAKPPMFVKLDDGKTYAALVMRYYDWPDLHTVIDSKNKKKDFVLSVGDHLLITLDIINKLFNIHALGKVHRDVKPENILIDLKNKKAIIIDFESMVDATAKLDRVSYSSGEYTAPDRIAVGKEDALSDVYSLGKTFYRLWQKICDKEDKLLPADGLKIKNIISQMHEPDRNKRCNLLDVAKVFLEIAESKKLDITPYKSFLAVISALDGIENYLKLYEKGAPEHINRYTWYAHPELHVNKHRASNIQKILENAEIGILNKLIVIYALLNNTSEKQLKEHVNKAFLKHTDLNIPKEAIRDLIVELNPELDEPTLEKICSRIDGDICTRDFTKEVENKILDTIQKGISQEEVIMTRRFTNGGS